MEILYLLKNNMKLNKLFLGVSYDAISVSLEKWGERTVRETHFSNVLSLHLHNSISAHWDQNEHRQCQLSYKVTQNKRKKKKSSRNKGQAGNTENFQSIIAWIADAVHGALKWAEDTAAAVKHSGRSCCCLLGVFVLLRESNREDVGVYVVSL